MRPLTTAGVARLVAEGLGTDPEPGFAAACREATGGIPFLVRMLVEALQEKGISPVAASAAKVPGVATATLGRWAGLRLARLGPDAARLARAVAILERAELAQAARLAGLTAAEAARTGEVLVRAGVLTERPLAFAHPLLRSAVYREIAVADRAEEHGRAARLLAEGHAGAARVAEHLLAAVPAGDGWVVEQLRTAAREAVAGGAPESATAYLRRALDEPPSPEASAGLQLMLGVAEFSTGQAGWEQHLGGAVADAGEDATGVIAALLFAQALVFHRRLAEAIEVCDRVAARLGGRDAGARLTLEAMAVACGMLDATTAPLVASRAGALLARARDGPVPRQAGAVAARVAALANRPAGQAADLARRAVAAGPRPLPEPGEPPWFNLAVVALILAECWADARELLDAAEAEARAAQRQGEAARLGQRPDLIQAADARVAQARANLAGTTARLADNAPRAAESGRVEDVFFQQGEWAPANQPILSLLPDSRIKVRFFVPERDLSAYRIGQTVRFACDGCPKGLSAKIAYISPRPEFTPPVIYSREARDRLVYLVEAQPSQRLNPGQPVDVEPVRSPGR